MNTRLHNIDETQEISLRLEQYDDIFSDFDMRPFARRALSVDFLDEIKRASLDKNESGVELSLFVREAGRSESDEATIRERLTGHFRKHFGLVLREKRRTLRRGWFMVFLGVIFMIAATLIIFEDPADNMLLSFFVVFLEPAAWFLLWEGMDQILFTSKEINPELSFYKKMASNPEHIHFKTY